MKNEEMYEQTAYFPVVERQQGQASTVTTRRQGRATDDVALPDDGDASIYDTRSPTSVRRYHAPSRTEIRVIRHQGVPPRASKEQQQQRASQPEARPRRRLHWFFFVGVGASVTMMLYLAASFVIVPQWDRMQDNAQYGYPRTYQSDADVKHGGGISHFIVENLHGHVFIIEMPMNNLSQSKMYPGPVLTGADADLAPATVTFQDVNGDRLPDMLVKVGTSQVTIYLNTGQGFRPANASDHITLGGKV